VNLSEFDCSVLELGEDSVKHYGDLIPDNLMRGLLNYICNHVKPGHFIGAVLANDLMTACACADTYSAKALPHICRFLYNEAPAPCHGSAERVVAWIQGAAPPVHNHGPEEGPGLLCRERRMPDGSLRGECLEGGGAGS